MKARQSMLLLDFLLGRRQNTREEQKEKLDAMSGVPVFGLDALGSAAYGPEAALTVMIPLGLAGTRAIVPITVLIILLLAAVCFSYLQTIGAYPEGGGSYTVASANLGRKWGLLAASALMIDYILTVSVGVSAGVGAMVSAVPQWQPRTLAICMGVLLILTLVNLRGVRETGSVFLIPTWLFVACMLGTLGFGIWKTIAAGGHPLPVAAPRREFCMGPFPHGCSSALSPADVPRSRASKR
jgi:amino acid transporter